MQNIGSFALKTKNNKIFKQLDIWHCSIIVGEEKDKIKFWRIDLKSFAQAKRPKEFIATAISHNLLIAQF